MWRCVVWVYLQPPLPDRLVRNHVEDSNDSGEEEVDEDESGSTRQAVSTNLKATETWWKIVTLVVELNMGTCTIAVLLVPTPFDGYGDGQNEVDESVTDEDEPLRRTLEVLQIMVGKTNPQIVVETLETLKQLLGVPSDDGGDTDIDADAHDIDEDEESKSADHSPFPKMQAQRLPTPSFPRAFFSAIPTLLGTEPKSLAGIVRVFEETSRSENVRRLTKAEVARGSTIVDEDEDEDGTGDGKPSSCGSYERYDDLSDLELELEFDGEGGRNDVGNRGKKSGELNKVKERKSWWMWEGLVNVWRGCLESLWNGKSAVGGHADNKQSQEKAGFRKDLLDSWVALVGIPVTFLQGLCLFCDVMRRAD
jgi:hypothetical protein